MLLAVGVALNATVAIYLNPSSRITFGLLAVAVCGCLFGPSPAVMVAALADIVVFVMRPTGPYFPGYTLTAALTGLVYGLAFYQKDIKLPRILLAQGVVSVVLNLVLNTMWSVLVQGRALAAILPIRLAANAVGYLIYVTILFLLLPFLKRRFQKV
jgi:ECF transporter S component (folate family)